MSEAILTLRELFEAPQDISARVEPELDAYAAVQEARQEIAKASRAIWWGWVRTAVAEKSQELLNLNVIDRPGRLLEEIPGDRAIRRHQEVREGRDDSRAIV